MGVTAAGSAAATTSPCSTCSRRDCSAARTSSAEEGLSWGSLARSFMMRSLRAGGSDGLWKEGATGGVFRCWEMTATGSWPEKGGLPVTIS